MGAPPSMQRSFPIQSTVTNGATRCRRKSSVSTSPWKLIKAAEIPPGRKIMKGKWVFKVEYNDD
eukprot:3504161-Prymnesium_polylepis.1